MPFYTRKVRGKNCYKVSKRVSNKTRKTKGRTVFSKCTTLENAKKQLRLLRAIQYGKNFIPRGSMKNRK